MVPRGYRMDVGSLARIAREVGLCLSALYCAHLVRRTSHVPDAVPMPAIPSLPSRLPPWRVARTTFADGLRLASVHTNKIHTHEIRPCTEFKC